MARKGHRERIVPVWDFAAWLKDTTALSLTTQAIWMAWLARLYEPDAGGRLKMTIEEWSKFGRCTIEEAKKAVQELRKWAVCQVRAPKVWSGCGQDVDICARRVEKAYKRKEYKRIHEENRRHGVECGQLHLAESAESGKNGSATDPKDLPKPKDFKDRSITRKPKDSPEGSISVSENIEELRIQIRTTDNPAQLAAEICREGKSLLTQNTFRKYLRKVGDQEFRSLLDTFAGELAANEIPRRRGAAFTARVKKLSEQLEVREEIRKSMSVGGHACGHCLDKGVIEGVTVPDESGFDEGKRVDLPCCFCKAGRREMEKRGMNIADMEKVRILIENHIGHGERKNEIAG